uniref:DUF4371 domain-containing protein n=1 Tax=Panagrolaimus superbus TaxID=310955 RepID=A0A914YXP9_9BILA
MNQRDIRAFFQPPSKKAKLCEIDETPKNELDNTSLPDLTSITGLDNLSDSTLTTGYDISSDLTITTGQDFPPSSSAANIETSSSSSPAASSNIETSSSSSSSPAASSNIESSSSNIVYSCLDIDPAEVINLKLSRKEALHVLENVFRPPLKFDFPSKEYGKSKKIRKPKDEWFERYPCMVWSKSKCGIYCIYCVLFSLDSGGNGNHQKLGKFVRLPFDNWKDFLECSRIHVENEYHLKAVAAVNSFSANFSSVVELLDENAEKDRAKAAKQLEEVIEAIKFCARYRLALRGTEDSGPFKLESDGSSREGILRGLLQYRGNKYEGINILSKAPLNAQYISPRIQNELLSIMAILIQKKLVVKINKSVGFTLFADETSSHSKEFLSIGIRFVNEKLEIREEFLGFWRVEDTSGEALANYLLKTLPELGIDMSKMLGQGYDGAANMCGINKGVSTRIQKLYPAASYFHCAIHGLNLGLNIDKNLAIKKVMAQAGSCAVFLHSTLRTSVFEKHTASVAAQMSGSRENIKHQNLNISLEIMYVPFIIVSPFLIFAVVLNDD